MYYIFNYINYLPKHLFLLFLYSFVLHNDYCVLIVITHQCIIYRYRSSIITSCYKYTHYLHVQKQLTKIRQIIRIAWFSITCVHILFEPYRQRRFLFNLRKTHQQTRISIETFSIFSTISLYAQPTVFFSFNSGWRYHRKTAARRAFLWTDARY